MVRTATLDLNSRGSFVDDLNSKPGIVMCRDALLHRSHEIQPAFFDSEKITFCYFFLFFFAKSRTSLFQVSSVRIGGDFIHVIFCVPGFFCVASGVDAESRRHLVRR